MTNRDRPNEKDPIKSLIVSDIHVELIERKYFSLFRQPLLDHLTADMCFNDMRSTHVSNAIEEAEASVSHANDGVLAEDQRLGALLRTCEFHENEASHERLDHHADDRLDTHGHDR